MAGRRSLGRRSAAAPVRAGFAPTRAQAVALLGVLVLVAAAVTVASIVVKPNRARAFDLFYGSIFLADVRAPVAVDLSSGKPTIRLVGADAQVSAKSPGELAVVPLEGATLLLNTTTGEFNMVDASGFVVKTAGGGVRLPSAAPGTEATAVASGPSAFVVQTGEAGTSVYLVRDTTVQSATGAGAKVTPRGYVSMPEPGSTQAGAAVAADGDLWLLVGTGATRTVRRLSLPRGSDPGVTLASEDHGTVGAPAAVGAARRLPDGSGGDVVAVAAAESVRLFRQGTHLADVAVHGVIGVDRILPASNQAGRLAFLYHSAAGWSLVSVRTDGTGRVGPVPLADIGPGAALAPPATSNGRLYTMDLGVSGRLWQIAPGGGQSPIAGTAAYPTATRSDGRALEAAEFDDAYVTARGTRVVFDSPEHVKALTVFTDGSRQPLTIDKSAATDLNASGGAADLTAAHLPARPQPATGPRPPVAPQQPRPVRPPVQQVNDRINCKTTAQVPHVPTITQALPGSRSVQLLWNYPLLDPQDCAPSTYTVDVQLISADAPSAPAPIVVQGQNGVTIGKLFPSTRYRVRVTAYLNGKGTPSDPIEVTTGPEGPAAPTGIHTAVDSSGNWTISWTSCGGIAQGCVPTASWTVVPSFCDGTGLAGPPPTIAVAGDPTQHSFALTYPGSDALLGRGLSFQVQGIGTEGAIGTPAADGTCSYSWSPPVKAAISVSASAPPPTSAGDSSTTTVSVRYAGNPVHAVGGVGATVIFRLLTGGTVVAEQGPVPYTQTTASFGGIRPGQRYQAAVAVTPARHDEARTDIGPVDIEPAVANWPQLTVSASFRNTSAFDGLLSVDVGGISSASSRGETFDVVGSLDCGNSSLDLRQGNVDPARILRFPGVSRLIYNGACSVTVRLAQNLSSATDPPFYGAGYSNAATAALPDPVDPPSLVAKPTDFSASWPDAPGPGPVGIAVAYDGADPFLVAFASNWSETVTPDGGTTTCGAAAQAPTNSVVITVDAKCLKDPNAASAKWTVSISFDYFGQSHTFTVPVTGTVPIPPPSSSTPTPTPSPSPSKTGP